MKDWIKDWKFKVLLIAGVLLLALIFGLLNRASVKRSLKSINSEYSGGLNRTVIVYDYNGNEIQRYDGKIDIEDNETAGKVKFDLDGKRTIIYGGIVVVQEK